MSGVVAVDFAAARTAQEARHCRAAVRKSGLSRSERDVLMVLVNLWFHHRGKGFIRPGKPLLVRRAKVSESTVSRALVKFKEMGLIAPLRYAAGGGRCATHYSVDTSLICEKFAPHGVKVMPGELVKVSFPVRSFDTPARGQNDTPARGQNDTPEGCQNDTLYIDTFRPVNSSQISSQDFETSAGEA
jgi:hypothetical protein